MNKIMKSLKISGLVLLAVLLTSCFAKEKTFTKGDISITLTNQFKEIDGGDFEMAYASNKYGFSAIGNAKSALNVSSLHAYTELVLSNAQRDGLTIQEYKDDQQTFEYVCYTAEAEGKTYKYMTVSKEGKDKYYTLNFWCFEKNFEDSKDQFIEWAKSAKVA